MVKGIIRSIRVESGESGVSGKFMIKFRHEKVMQRKESPIKQKTVKVVKVQEEFITKICTEKVIR